MLRIERRPPGSVAFVCHGNICRSPYAAAVLHDRLPPTLRERVRITSAGFIEPGRPPPPNAIRTARAHGHDLTGHRSKGLRAGEVDGAELVIVMTPRQKRSLRRILRRSASDVLVLGDLDPEPIRRRLIRDPIEQSADVFDVVYSRIDRCVNALAHSLVRGHDATGHGATRPEPRTSGSPGSGGT